MHSTDMKTIFLFATAHMMVIGSIASGVLKQISDDSLVQDGNVKLVAYMGMRSEDRMNPTKCGGVNPQTGITFFEAFRFAIDQVNSNMSVLYGAKLGYTLYDTCKSTARLKSRLRFDILGLGNVGFIGPPTSDEALFAAPILGIFGIPVISHSATSEELEDREKYGNFYRTVPSDRHQVYAFVDLVKHFNWTYVIAINSFGNYGQRGIDLFVRMVSQTNICIAHRISLIRTPSESYFDGIIRAINDDTMVKAVILYTTVEDTRELFFAAKRMGLRRGRFTWLGSAHWGNGDHLVKEVEDIADGAIVLNYMKKPLPGFRDYFLNLTPKTASYSWFKTFWENTFGCSLSGAKEPKCQGTERLRPGLGYEEVTREHVVSEAVYTFACGLNQFILEKCPGNELNKMECMRNNSILKNTKLWSIIRKKIQSGNLTCGLPFAAGRFGKDGGVEGNFDILNFRTTRFGFEYVRVGQYRSTSNIYLEGVALTLNASMIRWTNGSRITPTSVCSLPCAFDEVKVKSSDHPRCCWTCHRCQARDIVYNNTCVRCSKYLLPTKDRSSCFPLPFVYVDMAYSLSVVLVLFSAIGLMLTTAVLVVFIKHWESRVVKASGRELSSIMLIGLYMCFLAPIFFLSKPSPVICAIQRFIVGVSLTSCYTPLLLKTNRIYRIFRSAQKSITRPTMISPRSQILICSSLVCIQILLGVTWVAGNPPRIKNIELLGKEEVFQLCSESKLSVALNLAICVVMMLICTFFAFKTRKFPKNYNESKNIGITMYLSCFLWGVFVPMYLYSNDFSLNTKPYLLSIFCIVIAFVTLGGLFGSRVYVILFPNVALRGDEDKSFSTGIATKKTTLHVESGETSPSPRTCRCQENSQTFLNFSSKVDEAKIRFDDV